MRSPGRQPSGMESCRTSRSPSETGTRCFCVGWRTGGPLRRWPRIVCTCRFRNSHRGRKPFSDGGGEPFINKNPLHSSFRRLRSRGCWCSHVRFQGGDDLAYHVRVEQHFLAAPALDLVGVLGGDAIRSLAESEQRLQGPEMPPPHQQPQGQAPNSERDEEAEEPGSIHHCPLLTRAICQRVQRLPQAPSASAG